MAVHAPLSVALSFDPGDGERTGGSMISIPSIGSIFRDGMAIMTVRPLSPLMWRLKGSSTLPPQRRDQFIQLVQHLLHLRLGRWITHRDLQCRHGIAVAARAADRVVEFRQRYLSWRSLAA